MVDSNQILAEYAARSIKELPSLANRAVDKKESLDQMTVDVDYRYIVKLLEENE